MINKRLSSLLKESNLYIKKTILWYFIALIGNIIFVFFLSYILEQFFQGYMPMKEVIYIMIGFVMIIGIRYVCQICSAHTSYLASFGVKKTLREKIYNKLLVLDGDYQGKFSTSEIVQVSMEGVEQLEVYFGKYLPQLFYSLLAPIALFFVLAFINLKSAIVLLICVPLIPISIIAVQRFAKKLLAKYWGMYTNLGDSFLENLQGLTTLKIYQADGAKANQMDIEAEHFRKITMKVLTMQLNSISIMDLVAYGGAAIGIIIALLEYQKNNVSLMGLIVIILLSAEFFIPLRLLGSFFHIAMNGMAASDKIFKLLDIDEPINGSGQLENKPTTISFQNVDFAYDESRVILKNLQIKLPKIGMVGIVGPSGCGKSTIAGILSGKNKGYTGQIKFNEIELSEIAPESLRKHVTLVNHNGYLFAGSVRENLGMALATASDEAMWEVLNKVNLGGFIKEQGGLAFELLEQASNLSGGQRQRLVLARALLRKSTIYILDEATSNIDVESENDIMDVVHKLKDTSLIIMISHRLENIVAADNIYMLAEGKVVATGTHEDLMTSENPYRCLYTSQQELESVRKGEGSHE